MSKNKKTMLERLIVAILFTFPTAAADSFGLTPGCRQPDVYRGAP